MDLQKLMDQLNSPLMSDCEPLFSSWELEKSQCVSNSSIPACRFIMQKLNAMHNVNLDVNILLNSRKMH